MAQTRKVTKKLNTLDRKKHVSKLFESLTCPLPEYFEALVPSQTWAVYWITQSLSILERPQTIEMVREDVIEFIRECAHPDGGHGGGPGQIAHLATTFAAINALITVSSDDALESIDRLALVRFLHRMKQPDGSFTVHDDGEVDSRATYCAVAILKCLNIHDSVLLENVADWILSCQTYEGGFGSIPGSEAHGGYSFCCVASLCFLNQLHRADLSSLLRWLAQRQVPDEGGFSGRSNKLVDSCYSYWQGAIFVLLHSYLRKISQLNHNHNHPPSTTSTAQESEHSRASNERNHEDARSESSEDFNLKFDKFLTETWLFNSEALQDYILNKCQDVNGMLKDKPGTEPDFYHTCYSLGGLSMAQNQPDGSKLDIGFKQVNLVAPIHPMYNLTFDNLNACFRYFENKKLEIIKESNADE